MSVDIRWCIYKDEDKLWWDHPFPYFKKQRGQQWQQSWNNLTNGARVWSCRNVVNPNWKTLKRQTFLKLTLVFRCWVRVLSVVGIFNSSTNWFKIFNPKIQWSTVACKNLVTSSASSRWVESSNHPSLVIRQVSLISELVTKSWRVGPWLARYARM